MFDFHGYFAFAMQEAEENAALKWQRIRALANAWRLRELHAACYVAFGSLRTQVIAN